jgi:hypothetical protein
MASGEGIGRRFDRHWINWALVQAPQVEVGLVHRQDLDHAATPVAKKLLCGEG